MNRFSVGSGSLHFSLRSSDETVQIVRFSIVIIQQPLSDPLSDVLALSHLRAACSVRLRAGGRWALRFRPIELKFNVVRRGQCWLCVDGLPPRQMSAGDCFVIVRTPFVLASAPDVEAINASDVFDGSGLSARYGVGDDLEILGGSVSLSNPAALDLLNLLPAAVCIGAQSHGASSFAWLLDELDREWQSAQPGAVALCNDLLRLIFVHALRHHIRTADATDLAWLAGLRDPAIAAVLRAVHSTPERAWTLEQMAALACQSRSSFAASFKAKVGQSPVEYATRWRMQVAATRLTVEGDSVGAVAASLGYLSDAAFGVAFKRVHGKSPGQYRREHRL
ncbi:AraC family transcriptional regulator [Pseudomonas sp. RIT412]|nr:AraC family transcriptional regulator [Pseudomonas sp. RIT 409]RAU55497.1 AraC family transcriptional regulator [Pseudomonas sp. RIT 412]